MVTAGVFGCAEACQGPGPQLPPEAFWGELGDGQLSPGALEESLGAGLLVPECVLGSVGAGGKGVCHSLGAHQQSRCPVLGKKRAGRAWKGREGMWSSPERAAVLRAGTVLTAVSPGCSCSPGGTLVNSDAGLEFRHASGLQLWLWCSLVYSWPVQADPSGWQCQLRTAAVRGPGCALLPGLSATLSTPFLSSGE